MWNQEADADEGPCSRTSRNRGKAAADMVEDAIEEDADALLPAGVHQPLQVLLGVEPAVDAQVVDGVVAVRLRLEDGAQGEAVAAQREQVRQPRLEFPQPRHGGCAFRKR